MFFTPSAWFSKMQYLNLCTCCFGVKPAHIQRTDKWCITDVTMPITWGWCSVLCHSALSRQCSRSCDGGYRIREVRCLSDSVAPSDHCDPRLTPESREECNKQPCVAEISKSYQFSLIIHVINIQLYIKVIDFKDDVIRIYLHWLAIMNWMWIEVD